VKKFYVSLVHDLIGVYLEFNADSEQAVRSYLKHKYFDQKADVWKLPWCSVYSKRPVASCGQEPIIIPAGRGYTEDLYEADFIQEIQSPR
jgi:hypothetical protein